jgi:hypothetical protein
MKGLNVMYNFVRKPSTAFDFSNQSVNANVNPLDGRQVPASNQQISPDMTSSPVNLENIEIDDEFNLPISVAIMVLIVYMMVGAVMYMVSESWSFFESFYFVFVSISTIGLGDFVPVHPVYMLFSIIYLIFGLALTSMCINVVQLKLSESFQKASVKISTVIGMHIAEVASQQGSHNNSNTNSPYDFNKPNNNEINTQ